MARGDVSLQMGFNIALISILSLPGISSLTLYEGNDQICPQKGRSSNTVILISQKRSSFWAVILMVGSVNRITVTERIKAPFLV